MGLWVMLALSTSCRPSAPEPGTARKEPPKKGEEPRAGVQTSTVTCRDRPHGGRLFLVSLPWSKTLNSPHLRSLLPERLLVRDLQQPQIYEHLAGSCWLFPNWKEGTKNEQNS